MYSGIAAPEAMPRLEAFSQSQDEFNALSRQNLTMCDHQ
jgi:hypothetical protein